jgi:hypothetical protein
VPRPSEACLEVQALPSPGVVLHRDADGTIACSDSRRGRPPLPGSSPVIGDRSCLGAGPRRASPVPGRVCPRVPSAFTPVGPPPRPVVCCDGGARLPRTSSGSPPTNPPTPVSREAVLTALARFARATARGFAPAPGPVTTLDGTRRPLPSGAFFPSLRLLGWLPQPEGGLPDRTGNLSGSERFI